MASSNLTEGLLMETLFKIFEIVFAPTAIVAGIVYLLRKYLDTHFTKELEKFKSNLQSESERSKIEFQTSLEAKLFEFQTKFSVFHAKQAEIVAEFYKQFADVYSEISRLTAPLQFEDGIPLKNKKKKAFDLFNELAVFFSRNRIYFNEDLCVKISSVLKLMQSALIEFDVAHIYGMQGSESYKRDDTNKWHEAWKTVDEKIPPLLRELEVYFRAILESTYTKAEFKS